MDICDCMDSSHKSCCGGRSHREIAGDCDALSCHGHLDSQIHHQHEHCHSSVHHEKDLDKDYHEQRYHQLVLDREEIERNYDRERRERQAAEERFQRENKERTMYEERLVDLNSKLERYDGDLNILRNENGFLRSQFDSLRNVINSRVTVESRSFTSPNVAVFQSDSDLNATAGLDSYKHEISLLASENELFKQIIDIVNNQSQEKFTAEVSEKYVFESSWQTDTDKTRLQEENSKLKSQVRELQRSQRELESQLEDVNIDLEEKTRKMKKDIAQLEEDFHSKTIYCQDLERQIFQVSTEYQEEMQKMELKIESEVLKKTQFQEEVTVLENTIHRLELERIEMVAKLDELYNSENEIIIARNDLEARFSTEMNELQVRLEEEIRLKIELSQEMTVLMNEFIELKNKSSQMEEMYVSEIQALHLNLGAAVGDAAVFQNSGNNMAVSNMTSSSIQQPNNNITVGQRVPQGGGVRQTESDVQSQLNSEIQKREALERENKELLYKMKNMLSNDSNVDEVNDSRLNQYSCSSNDNSLNSDNSSELKRKVQILQNKVEELTDECDSLRRSAKKRKEAENKNRELTDELEELSSERDGMLRKQKALVKEVDKTSSSLQDLADRNRNLINEIDTASRKIRDMEDTFRQERNTLVRSFDREKTLDVSDFKRKVEDLEDRLKDQKRENKMLENKIVKLEDEIDELRSREHGSSQVTQKSTDRRSTKQSYSASSSASIPNSSYSSTASNANDLKQKTRELENVFKEKENDHLKDLEHQRQQLRDEFEKEKQALRQMYEEEKRNLFGGFSAGRQIGASALPSTITSQDNNGVSNIPGMINPHVGQLGTNSSQVSSAAFSSQQPSNAHQPFHAQNSFQSGTLQQPFASAQAQYPSSTSGQGAGIPVMQQGASLVGQMHSIPGSAPQQSITLTQQPSVATHPQYQGVSPQSNQNAAYPPHLSANNSHITQLNETINGLQQEINRLNVDKHNMEKRVKELEGKVGYHSGIVNTKTVNQTLKQGRRSDVGSSRVHFKVDQVSRPRNNQSDEATGLITSNSAGSYDQSDDETFRSDSRLIYSCDDHYDDSLDSKLQDTMKKLVDEHRQHSDELRKQMKLQKHSYERERATSAKENQKLVVSLRCFQKEIHVLKHENENLLQKLQRERRESSQREERVKEEIKIIRDEYEVKIKQESEKSMKTVQDLHNKINMYETKVKDIEMKFREELALMEHRFSQERIQLEVQLRETDNQVRSKLESHYQAKLKTERERYETSLKELRKEIKCLQDQRKEIQLKLTQDTGVGRLSLQNETFTSTSKAQAHYKRLHTEFENRYAQEKRSFEDTIRDLQKEIHELEKDKSDIKSSYKEEKTEMEERFEREKRRLEERHRRERDELKRSLEMMQISDHKFTSASGISSSDVFNSQQFAFQKKNTSLESKNILLESDIAFLKGRVCDLETRQTKILSSTRNKTLGMEDRKVKFDIDSRSDVRNISSTQSLSSREGRSSTKGLSRDDLGIHQSRIGPTTNNHQVAQSLRRLENNQSSSLGVSSGTKASLLTGNSSRSLGIVHIPSTGILNSGIDLAGSRQAISGRMTGNGGFSLQSGNGVIINSGSLSGGGSMSAMGTGFSGSSGFLSGNSAGAGSSMMLGGCGGSCSGSLLARGTGSGTAGVRGLGGSSSGSMLAYGTGSGTAGVGGLGGSSSGSLLARGTGSGTAGVGGLGGLGGASSGFMAGNARTGVTGMSIGGPHFAMMSGYGTGMGSSMSGASHGSGTSSGFLSGNGIGIGSSVVGGSGVGSGSMLISGNRTGVNGVGMTTGLVNGGSVSGFQSEGLSGSVLDRSDVAGHTSNGFHMNSNFLTGNGMAINSELSEFRSSSGGVSSGHGFKSGNDYTNELDAKSVVVDSST